MASKGTKNAKGASKISASKKTKQSDTKVAFKVPTIPEGLSFVAYREQLLGSPGPSQPHRRMRRWWLKDSEGKEHIAVETVKWDDELKRFEYTASEEFAKMLDVTCHSHKSVYEYLDLFLYPHKYQNLVEQPVLGSDTTPGDGKKRRRGTADSKVASKHEEEDSTGNKKKSVPGSKKSLKKSTVLKNSFELLENVSKELSTLQSSYGMRYSLTIIGPHGDVKVISSPTVEQIDIDPHEIEGFAYPQKLNLLSEAARGATEGPEKSGSESQPKEEIEKSAALPTATTENVDTYKTETESFENDDQTIDFTETVKVGSPPGLNALVEFVKETEETQYLPGSFWRRDPFPSIGIQNNIENIEIAPDAGQPKDIDRINTFLTISQETPPSKTEACIETFKSEPISCDASKFLIVPVWGIDTYTRSLLDVALMSCRSGLSSRDKRNIFFDRFFLPQLNKLQNEGWDTLKALECIHLNTRIPEEYRLAAKDVQELVGILEETSGTGVAVQRYQPLRPSGRRFSRGHPKGDGIILCKDDGIQKDTFIGYYGGHLCTPWRFYEKDASKASRGNTKSQSLLSTYTTTLERPNVDQFGSSILYIDATHVSNFVSRINHSCNPNCVLKKFIVGDKLKLGVWSVADIRDGEELSIDFRTKGDFERELQGLYCLCGSEYCEKSFVNMIAMTNPINTFFAEKYSILHRTKIILDSMRCGITKNDISRLERYGFKKMLLEDVTDMGKTQSIPEWLKVWTSHTLKIIEEESEELKTILHASDKSVEEMEFCEEDVKRLSLCRVRLLMVALDKAKLFLSGQEPEISQKPPLMLLDETGVASYLWNGSNSIAKRAVKVLESYLNSLVTSMGSKRSSRQQGSDNPNKLPWWQISADEKDQSMGSNNNTIDVTYLTNDEVLSKMKALLKAEKPKTAASARKALRKMASITAEGGPLHAGLHDLLIIYSKTKLFFSVTKFKPVKPHLADGKVGMRYRPSFLWALLCGWYKNAGDVVDALCNDRKGILCLPDVECCYLPSFTNGEYVRGDERNCLAKLFEGDVSSLWPRNLPSFTFKTMTHYFGSPQFDAVLNDTENGLSEDLLQVAQFIQESFQISPAS